MPDKISEIKINATKAFRAYCEYNLDTQLFKKVLAAEVELVLQRDIFLLDIRTKAKQTAITNIPETTFKMKI